jgi:hypothetical protein
MLRGIIIILCGGLARFLISKILAKGAKDCGHEKWMAGTIVCGAGENLTTICEKCLTKGLIVHLTSDDINKIEQIGINQFVNENSDRIVFGKSKFI